MALGEMPVLAASRRCGAFLGDEGPEMEHWRG